MENIVNVEGTELDVREYNGQMVVTFDDIDLVHKRPSGTARKAFNRNKKRFINGVDYIVLEKENSNVHRVDIRNIDIPNRGITVFTESGYLMLVNAYFALRNQHPAPTSTTAIEEKPTLEFETDWFCINRGKINYICRCYDITSKEYMHHLLEVLGRTYNFDEAKRIYSATTGNWKCRNSEVITYFPQLSDLASKILQKDLEDCTKEETP